MEADLRDEQLRVLEENLKVISANIDNKINQLNCRVTALQRAMKIHIEEKGCKE